MALEAETKSIVKQFEYTDDDVNKGVKEFLRQMSTCCAIAVLGLLAPICWALTNSPHKARGWRRTGRA
jgi:hypothetical protein